MLRPSLPVDFGPRSQRQRIVAAMLASCAEKTYRATTISDIVGRASISRTTFYKHFPDKRACFDATLEHALGELREIAAASVSSADSPAESVRNASAAILETLAGRPELAQLLAAEAVAVDPTSPHHYAQLLVPALEQLWDGDGNGDRATVRHTDPALVAGRTQLLIFGEVANGQGDRLLQLHPEIVYLTLVPFAGHDEAVRQASLAREDFRADPAARP